MTGNCIHCINASLVWASHFEIKKFLIVFITPPAKGLEHYSIEGCVDHTTFTVDWLHWFSDVALGMEDLISWGHVFDISLCVWRLAPVHIMFWFGGHTHQQTQMHMQAS